MAKYKQHKWNKEDLTIAYYYAKWGVVGLGIREFGLAEVIGTTEASLIKQAANFRACLGIEGYKLGHPLNQAKGKCDLCEELKNTTSTRVRDEVLRIIDSRHEDLKSLEISKVNARANKSKDTLNAQMEINFDNKLELMHNLGRRLKPIGTRLKK